MKRLVILTAVLASCLAASHVLADERGFYLGVSVGQGTVAFDAQNIRIDVDETAYKGFAGYNFTRILGAEATYVNLGSLDGTVDNVNFKVEPVGFAAYAVGRFPVSKRWFLFGKLGWSSFSTDLELGAEGEEPVRDSFSENGFSWGVGVYVILVRWLAIRGEWESYNLDRLDTVTLGSLALQFSF
jgi:hypothetical protein